MHILTSPQNFQSNFSLPSASQSHIPSLRRTPSVPVTDNVHTAHIPTLPSFDQRNNVHSPNSQCIQPLSPLAIPSPHASPSLHIPNNTIPSPSIHLPRPCTTRINIDPLQQPLQHQITYSPSSSLPSTKDVPLLTGKHDWGPWHSAVRTLILNANLLGMIPYPELTLTQASGPHTTPLSHRDPPRPKSSRSMTGGLVMVSQATFSHLVSRLPS